jgi:hypothetical protein
MACTCHAVLHHNNGSWKFMEAFQACHDVLSLPYTLVNLCLAVACLSHVITLVQALLFLPLSSASCFSELELLSFFSAGSHINFVLVFVKYARCYVVNKTSEFWPGVLCHQQGRAIY